MQVTLLFMDLKGFTAMSNAVSPQRVMLFINHLFARFDEEAEHHGVYKVRAL